MRSADIANVYLRILPSSIRITAFGSAPVAFTWWDIILKSSWSSVMKGVVHRDTALERGVVRGVFTADEYMLRFVGLITPDIVLIDVIFG